ncbi:hypothetical protein [Actinomadura sp. 6N118]|uniref:hypothetical protein n=1 Tax=Actinomadura sp. 6N118 TaxID=3375151 RepID=UPI00379E6DDE
MDEILRRIESAYGSLSEPHFGFIASGLEARPYAPLMEEVGQVFQVEDDTDPDDDHGFMYGLDREGRRWVLTISLVGPYAAFARLGKSWDTILTATVPGLLEEERWLINKLSSAGLKLLTREEMEQPVNLNLFNADPGTVRVYQALFTDTSILPWDKETLQRLGLI